MFNKNIKIELKDVQFDVMNLQVDLTNLTKEVKRLRHEMMGDIAMTDINLDETLEMIDSLATFVGADIELIDDEFVVTKAKKAKKTK